MSQRTLSSPSSNCTVGPAPLLPGFALTVGLAAAAAATPFWKRVKLAGKAAKTSWKSTSN